MASASHYLLDHICIVSNTNFTISSPGSSGTLKLHYLLQYTMLPLEQVLTLID